MPPLATTASPSPDRIARWRRPSASFSFELKWVTIAMVTQIGGQMISVKLLTSLISPAEYGYFALTWSAVQVLEASVFYPLLQAAARLAPTGEGRQFTMVPFHATARLLRWMLLGLLGILLPVIVYFVWWRRWQLVLLTVVGFLLIQVDLRQESWILVAQIGRLRKTLAIWKGADVWARVAAIGLSLTLLPKLAVVALATWAVTSNGVVPLTKRAVRSASAALTAGVPAPNLSRAAVRRQLWRFALPWAVASLFAWLQRSIDRWWVAALMGSNATGLFVGASQVGNALFLAESSLLIAFCSPLLYQAVNRGAKAGSLREARRLIRLTHLAYWTLGLLALAVLAGTVHWVVRLLLAPPYYALTNIVVLIAAGSLLLNWSQIQALSIMVTGHTKMLLLPETVSGLVAFGANYYLIRRFGLDGAAYGLVVVACVRGALLALTCAIAWRRPPLLLDEAAAGSSAEGAAPA